MSLPDKTSPLPPYPDRFYVAAQYVAIPGTCEINPSVRHAAPFSDGSSLLLYSLYQQAIYGPCNTPKPWAWNVVESAKWESWKSLKDMQSAEAMRLFVAHLEQEEPDWWEVVRQDYEENPVSLVSMQSSQADPALTTLEEIKSQTQNGKLEEVDPDPIGPLSDSILLSEIKNTWKTVEVDGKKPTARYQHSSTILGNKLYVYGGNYNGRYLNDMQVLNLTNLSWKKLEFPKSLLPPCAAHTMITRDNKSIWSIAGHSKNDSERVVIRSFDTISKTWSILKAKGHFPGARGGQTIDKVKNNLWMFGGEDSKRKLTNEVFMLDMETMVWEEVETKGNKPSPRSDHASMVYGDRLLFIFGGGSHSTCFNDLHILDLETLTWDQPEVSGDTPSPRAGHSASRIGKYWYIIGGGDNSGGIPETLVLEIDTMTWTVISSSSIAYEGLSIVTTSNSKDNILISFGGYNGKYSNEVYVFHPDMSSTNKASDATPDALPLSTQPTTITLSQKPINTLIYSIAMEEAKKVEEENSQSFKDGWKSLAKNSKDIDLAEQLTEAEEALARAEAIALNARSDAELIAGKAKADAWAAIAQAQMETEELKNKLVMASKLKEDAEEEARQAVAAKVNAQAVMGGLEAEAAQLRKDLATLRGRFSEVEEKYEKTKKDGELNKLQKDYSALKRSLADTEQELHSARGALASEQARCFRLEVEVAELRQRLQSMDALEREVELLRKQKDAADEAAAQAAAKSGAGSWTWFGGQANRY